MTRRNGITGRFLQKSYVHQAQYLVWVAKGRQAAIRSLHEALAAHGTDSAESRAEARAGLDYWQSVIDQGQILVDLIQRQPK